MRMKKILTISILLAVTMFLASCIKDNSINDQPTDHVTTTVYGIVNDEAGGPVAGATITVGVRTTVTDANGSFVLYDVNASSDRLVAFCKKNGYFNAARAETPVANGGTTIVLSMMRSTTTGTVQASSGGIVTASDGATVNLPGSAVGSYNGTIYVALRHLDPTNRTFWNYFSGDEQARRADGTDASLLSYGVLRVELTNGSGQSLQLAPGKEATLTYPVPLSMQGTAPATMPLWYFDETLGLWKEEGVATLVSGKYVGTVKHFSEWNCDNPANTATVKGRVIDPCTELFGLAGAVVTVGQRQVTTSNDGTFQRRVPVNITFDVFVDSLNNDGMYSARKTVGPFSAGQVYDVGNLTVNPGPAYVAGTIVDCNNLPVAGTVLVSWGTGSLIRYTQTGLFKLRIKANTASAIEATSFKGGYAAPMPVAPVASCMTSVVGALPACSGEGSYIDIPVMNGGSWLGISADGGRIAVSNFGGDMSVYDATTGQKISTINTPAIYGDYVRRALSADGSVVMTKAYSNDSVILWDVVSGTVRKKLRRIDSPILTSSADAVVGIDRSTTPPAVVKLDAATGAELARYAYTVETGQNAFDEVEALRSNNSQFVVVSNANQTNENTGPVKVTVWNMSTDVSASSFTTSKDVYFPWASASLDANVIVFSMYYYQRDTATFYNTTTGAVVGQWINPSWDSSGNSNFMGHVAISADNAQFAFEEYKNHSWQSPALYGIQSGQKERGLPVPFTAFSRPFGPFAFSSDGKFLAGTYYDQNDQAHAIVWKLK